MRKVGSHSWPISSDMNWIMDKSAKTPKKARPGGQTRLGEQWRQEDHSKMVGMVGIKANLWCARL